MVSMSIRRLSIVLVMVFVDIFLFLLVLIFGGEEFMEWEIKFKEINRMCYFMMSVSYIFE